MELYSLAENAAGSAATWISRARCLNLERGELQLCVLVSGPTKNPKYLPWLAIFMFFQSGMLFCNHFLTARMFLSEQTTEVKMKTHLLGLRDRPETCRNMLNILAQGIRECRLRSAAPKSSAQALLHFSLCLTRFRDIKSNLLD